MAIFHTISWGTAAILIGIVALRGDITQGRQGW
jgi:hypothetical protein